MIRIASCQLCLLTRPSTRSFSLGKVKWRKAAPAAAKSLDDLPDTTSLPTQEFIKIPPTVTALKNQKEIPPVVISISDDSLSKLVSQTKSKLKTSSYTISQAPLKLLNAVDPKVLDQAAAEAHKLDWVRLPGYYLGLSKFRLTGLVVVTAMAGYALAPASFAFIPFASLTLGTALTSASANTINQIMEVEFDSQMDRTKNRVLVRRNLSVQHARVFAAVTGIGGVALLAFGANELTAALGALNLALYTCLYTPMKRRTIANTWIGSIVGGIPPIMGWVACTGEISHGALLLGGILYAWQFPHFNALSWNLRKDYDKAGYKMMAITHPELLKKTSLRYSLGIIAMSSLAPVCNVTSWTFVADSLPLNGYLAYLAYRFYQDGDSSSSRKLFRFSLIHLPVLIMLMMVSKQNYKDKNCPAIENNLIPTLEPPPISPVLLSITETNFKQ